MHACPYRTTRTPSLSRSPVFPSPIRCPRSQAASSSTPVLAHDRVRADTPGNLSPAHGQPSSSERNPPQQPDSRRKPKEILYLKLDLPTPTNTRVKKATFVKSSISVKDCPPDRYPEIAMIGRSNVGKSSLINCLTEQEGLARVSRTPGMTKLINHYLANDSWYLVDLPGYGFAKTASKDSQFSWLKSTKNFFINRDNLVHVLLLVDSSLPPQQMDLDCARWLAECEVPFAVVFTKMDVERKKKEEATSCARNVRSFKEALAEDWEELPWCFETSAKSGMGRSELLGYLASLRALHTTNCG